MILMINKVIAEEMAIYVCTSKDRIVMRVGIPSCVRIMEMQKFNRTPPYYKNNSICLHSIVSFYNYNEARFEEPHNYAFDTYINGDKKIIGSFQPHSIPSWIDKENNSFVCVKE